jgi:hypothetical protein
MRDRPIAAPSFAAVLISAAAAALAGTLAMAGNSGSPSRCDIQDQLVGSWKVLSSRISYDTGGEEALGMRISRRLDLGTGEWVHAASRGAWSVRAIGPDDWRRWGIEPYGPWRMLVLSGWPGGEAGGPIEESAAGPIILWVIYRAGPPTVSAPGTVHLMLGRS